MGHMQILSIRVYQLMVMSYVGPPIHNVMTTVYNTVMPYLEVEQQEEEEAGKEEDKHKETEEAGKQWRWHSTGQYMILQI